MTNSHPLPHCPALLEKLTDTQLVNKFLTFFQHKYSHQTATVHCPLQDTSSPNLSDLLFKIHIFPSMPGSSKCYLSFKFSNLNFVCSNQFNSIFIQSHPVHYKFSRLTGYRIQSQVPAIVATYSPFLQATKALRESRGIALLCF
jgi:hypothetical protein